MDRLVRCRCGRRFRPFEESGAALAVCPTCVNSGEEPFDPLSLASAPAPTEPAAVETRTEFVFHTSDDGKTAFRSRAVLFSPWAVGLAGLCGGFLGGAVVFYLNYRALKQTQVGVLALVIGIVITGAVFLASVALLEPPIGVGAVVPMFSAFLLQGLAAGPVSLGSAWLFQRRAWDFHQRQGNDGVRLRSTVRIALICAGALFAVLFTFTYPFPWGGVPPVRAIYFGGMNQKLVYSVSIPKETAREVGKLLGRHGVFQNDQGRMVDVFLLKRDGFLEVRFFLDDRLGDYRLFMPAFRKMREDLRAGPLRDHEFEIVIWTHSGQQGAVTN